MKLPSLSVSPVAVVPSGKETFTCEFGSAVPVICLSALVTPFTLGISGTVVSVTVLVSA